MQRWRTKHDVRGICHQTNPFGGLFGGGFSPEQATPGAINWLNPFSSSGGGGGGISGPNGYNLGLFQVPIQASFLNPTATSTSTFDPKIYDNPTINQGALSNSLIIGPQIGGGQSTSSSASLFGGGGGGGGGSGGGNISDNINYHPSTTLVSNLPPPLQGFALQNMLGNGGSQATQPRMLPTPQANSPMGMMMNTPQPIAAGGVSPMMAGMMAIPQQQQLSGGQPVIPGSAAQAGGYDQPQQQSPMPGFNYPQRQSTPMQQGGVQQQGQPQGMSMQDRLAGAANPMAMAIVGDEGDVDGSDDESPEELRATAGSLNGATGKPMQAGTQGGQEAIDPIFNDAANRANEIGGQAKKDVSRAISDHNHMEKIIKAGDKLKRDPIEMARKDASKKLKEAGKAIDDILDPKKHNDKQQEFGDVRYNRLSPEEQAAVDRFKYGTSGQRPASAHPKLDTAIKVLRAIGRAGESGFGETGLLYAQQMRDYNRAHLQALSSAAQQKFDQHIYDKYNAGVEKDMEHYVSGLNNSRTAASAAVTDANEQENNLNTETQHALAQNKEDTYGTLHQMMSAHGIDLKANDSARTSYNEGLQNNDRKIGQAQRQQGLGISQQNANSNAKRAQTGQENYQRLKDKANADKTKGDLQVQDLQQKLKFTPFLPKTKTGYEQFRNNTLGLIKSGALSRQDANKLMQMAVSEGHLEDVPEAK